MGVFKTSGRLLVAARIGGLLTTLVAALVLWKLPRLTVPPEPPPVFVASTEFMLNEQRYGEREAG